MSLTKSRSWPMKSAPRTIMTKSDELDSSLEVSVGRSNLNIVVSEVHALTTVHFFRTQLLMTLVTSRREFRGNYAIVLTPGLAAQTYDVLRLPACSTGLASISTTRLNASTGAGNACRYLSVFGPIWLS